jgi:hypothetical protein
MTPPLPAIFFVSIICAWQCSGVKGWNPQALPTAEIRYPLPGKSALFSIGQGQALRWSSFALVKL